MNLTVLSCQSFLEATLFYSTILDSLEKSKILQPPSKDLTYTLHTLATCFLYREKGTSISVLLAHFVPTFLPKNSKFPFCTIHIP